MFILKILRIIYKKSGLSWIRRFLNAKLQNLKKSVTIYVLRQQPGVLIPKSVTIIGMPIIHLCGNSILTIGERCELVSSNNYSSMGINHPVFFRTVRSGAKILIGDDTGISGGTFVASIGITIGKGVLVGPNVTIIDSDFHPLKAEGRRHNQNPNDISSKPILIEDGVFLGAGAMILKGVHIGRNAVVGAGAVVTSDVPSCAIVAGNPAHPVGVVPE